jgi:hypothetical protein
MPLLEKRTLESKADLAMNNENQQLPFNPMGLFPICLCGLHPTLSTKAILHTFASQFSKQNYNPFGTLWNQIVTIKSFALLARSTAHFASCLKSHLIKHPKT